MWNFEDAAHQKFLETEAAADAARAEEQAMSNAMHALNESITKYALKYQLPVQVAKQGNKVTIDAREAGRMTVEAKTSTTFTTQSNKGHSYGAAHGMGSLKREVSESAATREIVNWLDEVRKAYSM